MSFITKKTLRTSIDWISVLVLFNTISTLEKDFVIFIGQGKIFAFTPEKELILCVHVDIEFYDGLTISVNYKEFFSLIKTYHPENKLSLRVVNNNLEITCKTKDDKKVSSIKKPIAHVNQEVLGILSHIENKFINELKFSIQEAISILCEEIDFVNNIRETEENTEVKGTVFFNLGISERHADIYAQIVKDSVLFTTTTQFIERDSIPDLDTGFYFNLPTFFAQLYNDLNKKTSETSLTISSDFSVIKRTNDFEWVTLYANTKINNIPISYKSIADTTYTFQEYITEFASANNNIPMQEITADLLSALQRVYLCFDSVAKNPVLNKDSLKINQDNIEQTEYLNLNNLQPYEVVLPVKYMIDFCKIANFTYFQIFCFYLNSENSKEGEIEAYVLLLTKESDILVEEVNNQFQSNISTASSVYIPLSKNNEGFLSENYSEEYPEF